MLKPFYLKLALSNIKKNRETYLPFLLTATATVMMYYILQSIALSNSLSLVKGGDDMRQILILGCFVVGLFSAIFLFYTNSFLIKRRRKEFGLYNILGMEKKHIGMMLFWETVLSALISLTVGLLAGILFAKLMFWLLLRMLHFYSPLVFELSVASIITTVILFAAIFFVILLFNSFQVAISRPIELLKGSSAGEKEPRVKPVLAILGVLTLAGGYLVASTIQNPFVAIMLFFVAVILVIIGTYLLFTTGSIALLKLLKKNKKLYYQTRHFTVISGMIYRMKQNAVGLANIAILSTMVLVTLSTTVCLYIGSGDALKKQFPYDITLTSRNKDATFEAEMIQTVDTIASQCDLTVDNLKEYHYQVATCALQGNTILARSDTEEDISEIDFLVLYMMTESEYNRLEKKQLSLQENEALLYIDYGELAVSSLQFGDFTLNITQTLDNLNVGRLSQAYISTYKTVFLVVKDEAVVSKLHSYVYNSVEFPGMLYRIMFDTTGEEANQEKFDARMVEVGDDTVQLESRYRAQGSFYSLYGGLLFIGIFLGSIFLLATVLIIYYKQISEGYDDKERYRIMQNVGMSKKEVQQSVGTQILYVFFIPLFTAMLHIGFAFHMITLMLMVFSLTNVALFALCTAATIGLFILFYIVVYLLTARIYYRIIG